LEERELGEYIVEIPENAKKQDLVDLKVFLNNQKS